MKKNILPLSALHTIKTPGPAATRTTACSLSHEEHDSLLAVLSSFKWMNVWRFRQLPTAMKQNIS